MKKVILFSFFSLLSLAIFAQSEGCGPDSGSSASANSASYNAYTHTKPAEAKVDFRVFPNPTTDYFALDALSLEKGNATRIQIYNTMGNRVRNFTVAKDTRYNVSDLEDGMYLVQFIDAKDKTITTRKLYKADHTARF